MLQGWLNFFLGLWIVLSGVVAPLNIWINYILTGIVVGIIGLWASKQWQGLLTGILGGWLIVSGFLPGLTRSANLIVVGLIVALASLWQALSVYQNPEME